MTAGGLPEGFRMRRTEPADADALAQLITTAFGRPDEADLVRLDAATGGVIWRVDLPYYTDSRVKKQDRIYSHFGPVLAGGRLFVASSDGVLRAFDPASGRLVGQGDIPGGAASAPVVAGQTLYVVSRAGQLHAFR